MARTIALSAAPLFALASVSSVGIGVQAAPGSTPAQLALSEVAPASVLNGNHATIQLQASDPGGTALNALAIRALLPAGVDYRAGSRTPSSAGEPQIVHDASAPGTTALVWSNLADLGTGSTVPLSFQVDPEVAPSANAIAPGKSFTIDSTAYASTDAATAPQFDVATGKADDGVVTATSTASTTISALTVTVTSPVADGKLLRGVHDHQGVFTVTVANNGVAPTQGVTLDGYLPAALEFLGCGNVDNGRVEYQYATALTGHSTAPAGCRPAIGETAALTTDALGQTLPASAAWTHVQWSIGGLAPGDRRSVSFLAAAPLRANVPFAANAPTPQSLGQLANLDDNTGPQTDHAGTQTVLFDARGVDVKGAAVAATGSTSVTPVDVTVAKSVDQAAFSAGQQVTETITVHTSEYVEARQLTVTDLLPSGIGPGLTAPNPAYATPPLENPDGTASPSFVIPHIAPNSSAQISVPLRDLVNYRANSVDAMPTLAGDIFTDAVTLTSSATTLRCASPDGLCAKGAVQGIDGTIPASVVSVSAGDSSLLQSAPPPVLTTSVAERPAAGKALDCATATYVPSTASGFIADDLVCFRVHAAFPAGVPTRNARLLVTLPSALAADGVPRVASGTTAVTAVAGTGIAKATSWRLGNAKPNDATGALYATPGQTFDVTIPARVTRGPAVGSVDEPVTAVASLSEAPASGAVQTQRSLMTVPLTDVRLSLVEEVASIADAQGKTIATYPPGSQVQGVTVNVGQKVTLRLMLTNSGGMSALAADAGETLPDGVACSSITGTDGVCSDGSTLVWNEAHGDAIAVAANSTQTRYLTETVPVALTAQGALNSMASVFSYGVSSDRGSTTRKASSMTSDPVFVPPHARLNAVPQNTPIGPIASNTTATFTFKVHNSGDDTAAGDSVTLTLTIPGASDPQFTSAACSQPAASGAFTWATTVTRDASSDPARYSCTGTATSALAAGADSAEVDFGFTAKGAGGSSVTLGTALSGSGTATIGSTPTVSVSFSKAQLVHAR